MHKSRRKRRSPIGLMLGVAIALLAAGGSAAWWAFENLSISKKSSSPIPSESVTPSQASPTATTPTEAVIPPISEQPAKEERAQVYWFSSSGDQIKLLSTPLIAQKSANKGEVIKIALEELLAGPQETAYTTVIPQGTKLLAVKLEKDGIHLNLSQAFTEGGGSESMAGRLKQILYTATSVDGDSKVWIDIEGQPLEELGGEGLMIEQPITRRWFQENFQF